MINFSNFIEVHNFGWNTLTITASITVLFTLFQGYGVVSQNRKIWRYQSAESLSAIMFFLYLFYFSAFFAYGLHKNSLVMVLNGLLAIPYIPVVLGIIKYKKLKAWELISLPIIALVVPIMIITAQKDLLLFILLMVSLVVLTTQPMEMFKTKTRGAVDIKFILIFSVTSLFWLVYSLIISNWPLIVFNALAQIVYALIIILYWQYRTRALKA